MAPALLPPSLRPLALLALLLGAGCREAAPPAWVRVEGPAPRLAGLPPAKAHLVVFWATWCPPCRTETPQLRALAARPPEGLSVVLYSHDTAWADVERFLGGPPEPALHLRLDEGRAAARAYGVETLPESFLVVEGRLVARFSGPRDWDSRAMRRLLERLVDR